jgi:hypothetical protein
MLISKIIGMWVYLTESLRAIVIYPVPGHLLMPEFFSWQLSNTTYIARKRKTFRLNFSCGINDKSTPQGSYSGAINTVLSHCYRRQLFIFSTSWKGRSEEFAERLLGKRLGWAQFQ